jgi:hypothetical protein
MQNSVRIFYICKSKRHLTNINRDRFPGSAYLTLYFTIKLNMETKGKRK